MPTPDDKISNNPEQTLEQQPTREITQTDHLNKKLLASLFKRMDEGGDNQLSKMLEEDSEPENEDDWKN